MDTTAIQVPDRAEDWMSKPEVRDRIGHALARWMDNDEFLAQIIIAFQEPEVIDCTAMSKFKSAHICASIQLLPTLGQVAFIPRKTKVKQKHEQRRKDGSVYVSEIEVEELQCTVMPQWQGYKAIMERNPAIESIDAQLVMEGESYSWDSTNHAFTHDYDPFVNRDVKQDLSNIKGGYLRVSFTDRTRSPKFHFVTVEDIRKAKKCAGTGGIWTAWPRQMAWKTIYRDGYARRVVPVDPLVNRDMEKVLEAEDRALQNDPKRVGKQTAQTVPLQEITDQINKKAINRIEAQNASRDFANESEQEQPGPETVAAKSTRVKQQQKQPEMTPEEIEEAYRREREEAEEVQ